MEEEEINTGEFPAITVYRCDPKVSKIMCRTSRKIVGIPGGELVRGSLLEYGKFQVVFEDRWWRCLDAPKEDVRCLLVYANDRALGVLTVSRDVAEQVEGTFDGDGPADFFAGWCGVACSAIEMLKEKHTGQKMSGGQVLGLLNAYLNAWLLEFHGIVRGMRDVSLAA